MSQTLGTSTIINLFESIVHFRLSYSSLIPTPLGVQVLLDLVVDASVVLHDELVQLYVREETGEP